MVEERKCRGRGAGAAPFATGPPERPSSVDDGAPLGDQGQDGHGVEGGVGQEIHAQPPGPVRNGGQDHAEDGQARQLDPLAVGEAEEEAVDDDRQDDGGGADVGPSRPSG